MNCKPGDLAIIIRSHMGNEGKIVSVNRWLETPEECSVSGVWECSGRNLTVLDFWTRKIVPAPGGYAGFRDAHLRPLREPEQETGNEQRKELENV